jgi:enoyl-CoA hydratase/carnithine racemase
MDREGDAERADAAAGHTGEAEGVPVLTVRGPRADIRLNRPSKLNRIEPADLAAIAGMIEAIDADSAVRVLVLTGAGRVFSAGYHLGDLDERTRAAGEGGGERSRFEEVADALDRCRVPTICALNGSVYGGSTDLALACDFRIGVEGSQMLMPAGKLGVHYYRGGLERYVLQLGLSAAKRLFLSARPIECEEMLRIGSLHEAVAPERLAARVDELAGTLAGNAPLALQHMKRALNQIARQNLDAEAFVAGYRACAESRDLREGIAAWKARRPAVFRGE